MKKKWLVATVLSALMLFTVACETKPEQNLPDEEVGSYESTPGILEDMDKVEVEFYGEQQVNPGERVTLTLATFHSRDIQSAVAQFNATNGGYFVEVVDYAEYNTADNMIAGLTKLSTEIISGNVPDIVDVSSLPYETYAARGLFTDLYQFIDSDPDISRSDFVDGVFHAAEIDGKLYQVFPSFSVYTIIGHPAVVGLDIGWNADTFRQVLNEHPEADLPINLWLTKTNYLKAAMTFDIDNYIDWENGTTLFDSEEFMQLLEYCNTLPKDIDLENPNDLANINAIFMPDEEAIPAGRQIMMQTALFDFWNFQCQKAYFGGELVFKGFPTNNCDGHSLSVNGGLAITENSSHKDGAWSFVRTILDKDWQLDNHWTIHGYLTNREAFDVKADEALAYEHKPDIINFPVERLTQSDVEQILAVIQNVSVVTAFGISEDGWGIDRDIWNIISETTSEYFAGKTTAQDAARVIQSRMSIYVSEKS